MHIKMISLQNSWSSCHLSLVCCASMRLQTRARTHTHFCTGCGAIHHKLPKLCAFFPLYRPLISQCLAISIYPIQIFIKVVGNTQRAIWHSSFWHTILFFCALDKLIKIQLCVLARGDEKNGALENYAVKTNVAAASTLCCCVVLLMVSNFFVVLFFAWFVSYFEKKQIVLLLLCSSTRIITSQSKEVNLTITTTATAAATLPEQQSYRLPKSKIYDVTRVCVVFNNKTKKKLWAQVFSLLMARACLCMFVRSFVHRHSKTKH